MEPTEKTTERRRREAPATVRGPEKLLLNVEEARAVIGCGRSKFYRLIERNEIVKIKHGGAARFYAPDINAYAQSLRHRANEEARAKTSAKTAA